MEQDKWLLSPSGQRHDKISLGERARISLNLETVQSNARVRSLLGT